MAQVLRELKRSLKTIHLWGIAVGLVISGEYLAGAAAGAAPGDEMLQA
jgi:ethanolamine permease